MQQPSLAKLQPEARAYVTQHEKGLITAFGLLRWTVKQWTVTIARHEERVHSFRNRWQ
jgi:hypothetical protein